MDQPNDTFSSLVVTWFVGHIPHEYLLILMCTSSFLIILLIFIFILNVFILIFWLYLFVLHHLLNLVTIVINSLYPINLFSSLRRFRVSTIIERGAPALILASPDPSLPKSNLSAPPPKSLAKTVVKKATFNPKSNTITKRPAHLPKKAIPYMNSRITSSNTSASSFPCQSRVPLTNSVFLTPELPPLPSDSVSSYSFLMCDDKERRDTPNSSDDEIYPGRVISCPSCHAPIDRIPYS